MLVTLGTKRVMVKLSTSQNEKLMQYLFTIYSDCPCSICSPGRVFSHTSINELSSG